MNMIAMVKKVIVLKMMVRNHDWWSWLWQLIINDDDDVNGYLFLAWLQPALRPGSRHPSPAREVFSVDVFRRGVGVISTHPLRESSTSAILLCNKMLYLDIMMRAFFSTLVKLRPFQTSCSQNHHVHRFIGLYYTEILHYLLHSLLK